MTCWALAELSGSGPCRADDKPTTWPRIRHHVPPAAGVCAGAAVFQEQADVDTSKTTARGTGAFPLPLYLGLCIPSSGLLGSPKSFVLLSLMANFQAWFSLTLRGLPTSCLPLLLEETRPRDTTLAYHRRTLLAAPFLVSFTPLSLPLSFPKQGLQIPRFPHRCHRSDCFQCHLHADDWNLHLHPRPPPELQLQTGSCRPSTRLPNTRLKPTVPRLLISISKLSLIFVH